MLIDCHIHTTLYSPCSRLTPEAACKRALAKGLQGIVLTEHQRQWPAREIEALRFEFPDLAIFNGMELTLDNDQDVVLITEEKELEFAFHLPLEKVISSGGIDPEQSFFFLAHMFRWSTRPPQDFDFLVSRMHGIEMNSLNILRGQYVLEKNRYKPTTEFLYRETSERFNLRQVYNSDAHDISAVGALANELPCSSPPGSEAELAALLKEQAPGEYQDPELLGSLLRP